MDYLFEKVLLTLVIGHLFMVVLTFGHLANNKACDDACQFSTGASLAVLGLGWPFYWSWELQRSE